MKFRLRYVVEDTDRHGNVRLYYRRKGCSKVRLPGPVGSPDFLTAYKAATEVPKLPASAMATVPGQVKPGSIGALVRDYARCASFRALDPRTQRVRLGILERFCANKGDGDKPAALLLPKHIRKRRDEMMDRPEAANGMVKALRQLFRFAVEYEHVDRNPAKDVPYLLSRNPDGFHSWTLNEIRQFEAQHPIGSTARLALALLLYTAQRRSDVVLFGPQHVKDGRLVFTQVKGRKRKPVALEIRIIPELQRIIDATPCGRTAFMINRLGRAFTANGFGNWSRDRCDEAKLPQCSAHGLRKATAARLAELGRSEQEIMAVTGHRTSKEVTRYTRAASQRVRGDAALASLSFAGDEQSVPPP